MPASTIDPVTPSPHAVAQDLFLTIGSIAKFFSDTQSVWAKSLGMTNPQWQIVTVIIDMDVGTGVSVADVAKKLRVDPSFVTAQTKLLEKAGHIRRVPSKKDGRVVLMSLSDRARKQIASLQARQQTLTEFLLSDLGDEEIIAMLESSKKLERRFAKALHLLAINE